MNPTNTSSPSRDPRLNPNIPRSLPRTQPANPPGSTDNDALVSDALFLNISDLVQNAVEASVIQAEHDRLQKNKEASKDLMQQAQSQRHFRATTAFFENAVKEQDANIRRVDEALKNNKLRYKEIEQGPLRSKWSLDSASPAAELKIKKLEDEMRAVLSHAAQAKDEALKLKERNQTLEKDLEQIQEKLATVQQASTKNSSDVQILYKTTGNLSVTSDRHTKSLNKFGNLSGQLETQKLEQLLNEVHRLSRDNSDKLRGLSETGSKHSQRLDQLESPDGLIKTEIARVSARLDSFGVMRKNHDDLATKVKTMDVAVQDHNLKLNQDNINTMLTLFDNWKSLEPRLKAFEARLERLDSNSKSGVTSTALKSQNLPAASDPPESNAAQVPSDASELRKAVDHNTDMINRLAKIHEFKDIQISEQTEELKTELEELHKQVDSVQIEALKKEFEELRKQVHSVQTDHGRLSSEDRVADLPKLVQHVNDLQADYVRVSGSVAKIEELRIGDCLHQLWASLDQVNRSGQSVSVGLRSLETRYNNLSTEPIVKSMVVAMQEMYPSADQLIEEVKRLTERIETDLPTLEHKIEDLTKAHENNKTESDTVTSRCLGISDSLRLKKHVEQELSELKPKIEHLTEAYKSHEREIAPLKNQVRDLIQTLDAFKEFPSLRRHVDQLMQDIGSHQNDIPPLKEQVKQLVQALENHEEQVNALKEMIEEFEKLPDRMTKIESINQSNSEIIKPHEDKFNDLTARITLLDVDINRKLTKLMDFVDNQVTEPQSQPDEIELPMLDGTSTCKQESPVRPAAHFEAVQNTPSLLPKTKKKKKRARRATLSDDERPSTVASPPPITQETSTERRRSKKKKRARPSALSDDEQPSMAPVPSSSNMVSSPQPPTREISSEQRRPKKKKKRQSTIDNPILVDD